MRHSLRFRLAATFVVFGALLSVLLSTALYFAVTDQSQRLMDETLAAEIEDMAVRLTRNPNALPPATLSVRGYVFTPGREPPAIPLAVRALSPGRGELVLDGIPYRSAIEDRGGTRYVMLFNESGQRQRAEAFWTYWLLGTVVVMLLAAAIGWWLSGKIVSPVAELARRVSAARFEDDSRAIERGFAADEIGRLAKVFGSYLRRMRAFSERERAFTADVSHELRTPLAIIQGAVELLEDDGGGDEKQRQRIARIARAARQMAELIRALLLMARENKPDEASSKDCDVWEVVRDTVENHRYLLGDRVSLELACDGPLQLAAERSSLGIVVANLIRNAFTYTDAGCVTIRLGAGCLTVSDTGRGISGEEIGKVFDRHFKGASSSGEGIGLSLVKRICDRYGWVVHIDSAPGKGTTAQLVFVSSPLS